ncbi:MAG: hypothetical protein LBH28_06445 [Oscillospiraceae bacterium]|nr:hypothetical protein [Oscillospiraceae bacterium]
MTEKEFWDEARKKGLKEDNIRMAIENYYSIKKEMPSLVLDEMIIEYALKTQERTDNESDDFISLD